MNLLQLSWKNLLHKPLNMSLSLILFALGVGLISLLLNLNQQVEDNFNKNLAGIDLVIGAKGSPMQLILCSMYHVDNPTGNIPIEKARAFLNPKHPLISLAVPLSLGDSYKGFRIVGTTYEMLQLYQAELDEGKLWQENMEVTLGASVAKAHHLHVGDTFKSSHGLVEGIEEHEHDFTVVGILKPTGSVIDQLILTNSQSIWEVHEHAAENGQPADGEAGKDSTHHQTGHKHDHANHSHEKVAPVQQIQQEGFQIPYSSSAAALMDYAEEEITSILIKFRNRMNFQAQNMGRNINENTDLQAANPPIEIARLQTNLGVGAKALNKLAWVIVVVSGLSIFISLFSSLKERKYELALMRVMGGTRRTLFVLIILEGLLLAVLGYVIGIVLSHAGLVVLADLMQDAYRYSFTAFRFLKEEAWLLGGALLIGFLAALIPALQARQTDISETLAKG
jgi:putative ABC transport system permease protein